MKIRNQFQDRYDVPFIDFPDSQVQSNMSPSISQMVKHRAVGGQIDEYSMDGIAEDAPFESEYVDFFEAADMAGEAIEAAEIQRDSNNKIAAEHHKKAKSKSKDTPPDSGDAPPSSDEDQNQTN